MQRDEVGKAIADLSITDVDDSGIKAAATRLAKEAGQALRFQKRGVQDVTEAFTAASKLLPPGQLVKDEFFTLFDAVGALEIMDPKMDSGFVPPGDTFEADFDPCAGLEAERIIWIMDRLLCLEITWHEGYPLAQTVYTSLHIDRLLAPANKPPYTFPFGQAPTADSTTEQSLVHTVLHAYCIGLIETCQLALFWIKAQTYFEEEDFVSHLFGRELLPGIGSVTARELLEEAEKELLTYPISEETKNALLVRLRFRRHYLDSADFAEEHWDDNLPNMLQSINSTHQLCVDTPQAFSEKVQRQLATSTPPRPMVTVSWEEAMEKWAKMFLDMTAAHNLIVAPVAQSPHCYQRATWAFAYRQPQPGAFARARMQDLLLDEQSVAHRVPHYELLLNDIANLVLAGDSLVDPESFQVELPSDPRHMRSRIMEEYLDKALEEYLNLYRMVCQNRCRIRRTFAQAIAIWDALETEGLKADERLALAAPALPSKTVNVQPITFDPLSSWARFKRLQVTAWTIQLGFETDIYLPDELGGMYWFLSRVAAERCTLLDHIQRCLQQRIRRLGRSLSSNAARECRESQIWLQSLTASAEATQLIAYALWRFYTVLTAVKIISIPKRDFAHAELLCEARFKSFLPVTNSLVPTCAELQVANTLDVTLAAACKEIDAAIKRAKPLLAELKRMTPEQAQYVGTEAEWAKEIKQMETTCVAIAVAALQLLRIADKAGRQDARGGEDLGALIECEIPPHGSKRYHEWWVVPQVRERKVTAG